MKPIISKIPVFDALQGTTVTYVCYGQVTSIKYTIYDNDSGDAVYTAIVSSITQTTGQITDTFNIPAKAIVNQALPYYIKIQTQVDDDSDYGELSDPVLFYCHLTPTLEFYGLETDNATTIGSSSYEFGLVYSYVSEQNETLASYQYLLYDSNKTLIDQSKAGYGSTISTFKVNGLDNNEEYFIRGTAITINGYELDTGCLCLNINYPISYSSALLTGTNNYKQGTITITSNISILDGELTSGTEAYVLVDTEDYAVDLTDGSTIKYSLPTGSDWYAFSDFLLYMKLSPVINETVLTITETDSSGTVSTISVYFVVRTFTDYEVDGEDDTNTKIIGVVESDAYTVHSNYLNYVSGEYLNAVLCRSGGYYTFYIYYDSTAAATSLDEEV